VGYSISSSPQFTESQNHRIVGVGRDLCGSSSPTLLPKQGHLQQAAQDLVQAPPVSYHQRVVTGLCALRQDSRREKEQWVGIKQGVASEISPLLVHGTGGTASKGAERVFFTTGSL